MATRNYSRQRESIKQFLSGRTDHPTAEYVYDCLRKEHPHISMGTVYRNLALLSEDGEIQKISTGLGPDHFDGDVSPHCHFICRECRRVQDVFSNIITELIEEEQEQIDGIVEHISLNFFGICSACSKMQSEAAP